MIDIKTILFLGVVTGQLIQFAMPEVPHWLRWLTLFVTSFLVVVIGGFIERRFNQAERDEVKKCEPWDK